MLSTSLSTLSVSSEWTPTQNDWVQIHIVNITSSYFVDNMLMKFSFESDAGNNLFIDEINLYQGGPGSLGLDEIGNLENLVLYPNPADEELNIQFSVNDNTDVNLVVQDITGKRIRTSLVKASSGKNLVMMNTSDLASGMYFMNVLQGNSKKTIQFVIK
jgi:hypothetical protein